MKVIAWVVLALAVSSCDSKGNYLPALPSGATNGTTPTPYASCTTPPAGAVAQAGCPTTTGRWDNYEVVYDGTGNVISNKLFCNGTDQDHPTTQTDYDALFVGATSLSDFKIGSDCASGAHIPPGGDFTQNIWRKK